MWVGGCNGPRKTSPSSPDSNYLRVHNAYTNRRLSDNTLMAPKIKIAPSCASSPGGPGSPGGPLPIRRHSSFGPQERRGSTVNLSPPSERQCCQLAKSSLTQGFYDPEDWALGRVSRPLWFTEPNITLGGSMPNTSSSVPHLLSSSMHSILRSRRPSTCLSGSGSQTGGASGLWNQFGSGMVRQIVNTQHSTVNGRAFPGTNIKLFDWTELMIEARVLIPLQNFVSTNDKNDKQADQAID
ncbi:unnamed protein product [Bemisia tabaci]|uniref:Uncharacterized protein n=1 Tax=Bemisia tabaci TaxID=7038 RepID=A0A9P0F9M1_BEMTA|nr:unnamed protein product [Bemisia tabaci]